MAAAPVDNRIALYNAARDGDVAEVSRILTEHPDLYINYINQGTGFSPFYIATKNGHRAVIERLLAVPRIDVNMMTRENQLTPLFIACSNGNIELVNLFLSLEPRFRIERSLKQASVALIDLYSPLGIAIKNGHAEIINRLLDDPRTPLNKTDIFGLRDSVLPLIAAVAKQDLPTIQRLIEIGTDADAPAHRRININEPDAIRGHGIVENTNPLGIASQLGNLAIVNALLGVPDIQVNAGDKSPLYIASENGHLPIVERLLEHPHIQVNRGGRRDVSPLYIAVKNRHVPIVERLLRVPGINVNRRYQVQNLDFRLVDVGTIFDLARNIFDFPERRAQILALLQRFPEPAPPPAPAPVRARNRDDLGDWEPAGLINNGEDENEPEPEPEPEHEEENRSGLWKGISRLDFEKMENIFKTDHPPGVRPPSDNWSCCPICLAYSERATGCMYITHNCSNTGSYHKRLYNKYKRPDGTVEWCTLCGRICVGHRHYKLSLASDPTREKHRDTGNYFGNEDDCIAAGGGGLNEKIARFRRIREVALELNTQIGKITYQVARLRIIEEAWNAPLNPSELVPSIRAEGKWNAAVANELYPSSENLRKLTTAAGLPDVEAAAPNIPWPFAGIDDLHPIIHERGANSTNLNEVKNYVIQFRHREKDGKKNDHIGEFVSYQSLFGRGEMLQSSIGNTTGGKFGQCPFESCNAIIYPDELQYILDHIPDTEISSEIREQYQTRITNYKLLFNERFGDKARLAANARAAATMLAGAAAPNAGAAAANAGAAGMIEGGGGGGVGAGAAAPNAEVVAANAGAGAAAGAGQGGGRRRRRTIRRHHRRSTRKSFLRSTRNQRN